jgi:guanylate kinase
MKNLFILDGASGTGKSDFLNYVRSFHHNIAVVEKYTTRNIRKFESKDPYYYLDLHFVDEAEFESLGLKYWYNYSGKKYGFSKSELEQKLSLNDNVFVIIRNSTLIKRIAEDYDFINVVPVYIYTDKIEIRNRLLSEKTYSEDQINFRLKRIKIAFEDYLNNANIYSEIIINNSSIEDYHRLIKQLIEKYNDIPAVDEKLIFVLMSFNPKNPALQDYYKAMQRAVKSIDSSFVCINLDEIDGSFKISSTAKSKISNCRLAIVDITENKQNVYYELGFTHGIDKDCIITAHESTEILFYPGEYRVLKYNSATELEAKLKKSLAVILK